MMSDDYDELVKILDEYFDRKNATADDILMKLASAVIEAARMNDHD